MFKKACALETNLACIEIKKHVLGHWLESMFSFNTPATLNDGFVSVLIFIWLPPITFKANFILGNNL